MMEIEVDQREGIKVFPKLEKLAKKYVFTYVKKLLPVGDYLYREGSVCMERKEISDFYSSVISGRIFEQVMNMKKNFDNVIVGISGDTRTAYFKNMNFDVSKYRGAIASLVVKYKCSVFNSNSDTELLDIFLRMCKKSTEPFNAVLHRIEYKDEDVYVNMLTAIPMVSYKRAKDILDVYSFKSLCNISVEDLKKISGIGDKVANQIKKYV